MKAVRFTWYPDPASGMAPITLAAPEDSFNESLGDLQGPESLFCVKDVFDTDETGMLEITSQAQGRMLASAKDEVNMAVMYYWTLGHARLLKPGGKIHQTERSPLTVDQLKYVHEQLKRNPDWPEGRGCLSIAEDGTTVTI